MNISVLRTFDVVVHANTQPADNDRIHTAMHTANVTIIRNMEDVIRDTVGRIDSAT